MTEKEGVKNISAARIYINKNDWSDRLVERGKNALMKFNVLFSNFPSLRHMVFKSNAQRFPTIYFKGVSITIWKRVTWVAIQVAPLLLCSYRPRLLRARRAWTLLNSMLWVIAPFWFQTEMPVIDWEGMKNRESGERWAFQI